jgi:hypothetical protein
MFATAGAVVALVALMACSIPAERAVRVGRVLKVREADARDRAPVDGPRSVGPDISQGPAKLASFMTMLALGDI